MPMTLPDSCQKCGACCGFGPNWVEVEKDDTQVPANLTERTNPNLWPGVPKSKLPPMVMRSEGYRNDKLPFVPSDPMARGQRCIALRGEIGKETSCSIYPNRPHVCRTFERGSPECTWILGWYGIGRPW